MIVCLLLQTLPPLSTCILVCEICSKAVSLADIILGGLKALGVVPVGSEKQNVLGR